MPSRIYALSDPRSGEIRYIGKTASRPRKRLAQHIADAKFYARTRVHRWLNSLGQWPTMTILAIVEDDMCAETEIKAIAWFREHGYNLVNLTNGGEGLLGVKLSDAHRKILSEKGKLRGAPKVTPEGRARVAAFWRGRKHTPETLVKLRESHLLIGPKQVRGKGLKSGQVTPEGRANQIAAIMGNKFAVRKHSAEEIVIRAASLRRALAVKHDRLIIGPDWEAQPLGREAIRELRRIRRWAEGIGLPFVRHLALGDG